MTNQDLLEIYAQYLLYGVRVQHTLKDRVDLLYVIGITNDGGRIRYENEVDNDPEFSLQVCHKWHHRYRSHGFSIIQRGFKLLLRPLSDLTKEIEHKGERFVPILKWTDLPDWATVISMGYADKHYYATFGIEDDIVSYKIPGDVDSMNFYTVKKLLSWYFDIFGLINRGLAINLNDFEK